MADASLDEVLELLKQFPRTIAEQCRDIMKYETPVGASGGGQGGLRASIRIIEQTDQYAVIGTDLDYAPKVENGRGPVHPHPGRSAYKPTLPHTLRYFEYAPGPKSVHIQRHPIGTPIYRHMVGPSKPNPFAERTVQDIRGAEISLRGIEKWVKS